MFHEGSASLAAAFTSGSTPPPHLGGMKILALALVLAATPAAASLPEVVAHLKATRTFTADFTQTAASGAMLTGRVTLARPGRVRFQYDRAPILVVADGRALNLIDYQVSQVSSWPIRGTPLAVLLDADLDLARFARVTRDDARGVTIEAQDAKHPEYGVTTLSFARDRAAPAGLRLTGWRVLDAQGATTRVTLDNLRFNAAVDPKTFKFRDPRPRRVPGKG